MDTNTLAEEIGALTCHYFYDRGWGRCIPCVSYNE